MSYISTKLQIVNTNDGETTTKFQTFSGIETVGKDLVIHRTVVRSDNGEVNAAGSTWVVSLKVSGVAIVNRISSRQKAREIARSLAPFVESFRLNVAKHQKLVDAGRVWIGF